MKVLGCSFVQDYNAGFRMTFKVWVISSCRLAAEVCGFTLSDEATPTLVVPDWMLLAPPTMNTGTSPGRNPTLLKNLLLLWEQFFIYSSRTPWSCTAHKYISVFLLYSGWCKSFTTLTSIGPSQTSFFHTWNFSLTHCEWDLPVRTCIVENEWATIQAHAAVHAFTSVSQQDI